MRRNVQNWFLCGLSFAGVLSLAGLTIALARAALLSGDGFGVFPLLLGAVICGGVFWLLKRDGRFPRRVRGGAAYCFISRERKARIEDVF